MRLIKSFHPSDVKSSWARANPTTSPCWKLRAAIGDFWLKPTIAAWSNLDGAAFCANTGMPRKTVIAKTLKWPRISDSSHLSSQDVASYPVDDTVHFALTRSKYIESHVQLVISAGWKQPERV